MPKEELLLEWLKVWSTYFTLLWVRTTCVSRMLWPDSGKL